ncbi:MAG: hypothetical protein KGO96_12670 [Elusimicrobia bacterium]|nr:hypothetical protein [Elusimicrobiota bacterium]
MLTTRQIAVLKVLADGWVMDRAGKDGLAAILTGRKGQSASVSRSTVSALLNEGLIETTHADVTDFRIASIGRMALQCMVTRKAKLN